jgi:hypothetical protein
MESVYTSKIFAAIISIPPQQGHHNAAQVLVGQ